MVNHDVVRLDITVHDALRVAEIKRFQDFVHIEANVEVVETLVQLAEIRVTRIDELRNNRRCLGQWVPHDVDQLNDVHATF